MLCIYMLLCYASYVCHFFYCYHMYVLFLVPHLHQPVAEGVTILNNNNNNKKNKNKNRGQDNRDCMVKDWVARWSHDGILPKHYPGQAQWIQYCSNTTTVFIIEWRQPWCCRSIRSVSWLTWTGNFSKANNIYTYMAPCTEWGMQMMTLQYTPLTKILLG